MGEYDSYGSIENIKEDWATAAFLAYCNEQFCSRALGCLMSPQKARIEIFDVKSPFETV